MGYEGTVIDTHLHYGLDPVIIEHLIVTEMVFDQPDSVIHAMDLNGIDKAVLLPPDRMLNPPRDVEFTQVNEAVARAVAKHPDRLIGTMRLNPLFGEEFIWSTVKHFAVERKLKGIKLVSRADFYSPSNLKIMGPVLEAAGQYDLTVLFHSGHPSRDLPSLQAYAARHYPGTRMVLAHIGLHDYVNEAIIACKELPNVFADMGQAYPYDIKAFVAAVGAEKLMYGTDAPCQSPRVERLKVEECRFNDAQLELIFHKNAERIWGFAPSRT